MIEVVVLGAPVAKGRPRFVKETGRAFTPQKTRNFEAMLNYAAAEVMGDNPPLEGPLGLRVDIRVPIPRSWSKKKQAAARSGELWPTSKPDWDNYGKVVDACNLVLWVDDGQIVDGRVVKKYGEKPGTWVRVWPIDETEGVFA